MLDIRFEKNSLIVQATFREFVEDWEHRLFFITILGFQVEEDRYQFRLTRTADDIYSILDEVVTYLQAEGH